MKKLVLAAPWAILWTGIVACSDPSTDDTAATGGSAATDDGSGGTDDGATGGAGPNEPCGAANCAERQVCDRSGAEPVCVCAEGFAGQRCEDVPECAAAEACGEHADCLEGYGNHGCSCHAGFEADGALGCQDRDECELDGLCAPGASCSNLPGDYLCVCPEGEFGNGHFCKEVAGCTGGDCNGHGACVETPSGSVCQCELGYSGGSCSTTCTTVQFADPALQAVVRELVQKPTGDLLPSDLEGLTQLNAGDRAIASLAGLECWPHLRELNLSFNELVASDLEVLAQLNQLESLDLDCNAIDSLEALVDHPTLRELSLSQSGPDCEPQALDLTDVASLDRLERLDLSGQALASVAALAGSRSLRALRLGSSSLDDADLSALGSLPLLEELVVSQGQLASTSWAVNFPALRRLEAAGNAISDLGGLETLVGLERLVLADNAILDLSALASLSSLRELDLAQNQIVELTALESLTALGELWLDQNEIVGIGSLVDPARRGILTLFGNPLLCDVENWASESQHAAALVQQGVDFYPWPNEATGCP